MDNNEFFTDDLLSDMDKCRLSEFEEIQ